ncbi:MAG: hypothetical protein HQM08_24860 [Candidatus Riflebacteria bacterium]|nr:hypothetical protein [Candidatus Riflebacteria bacterium]
MKYFEESQPKPLKNHGFSLLELLLAIILAKRKTNKAPASERLVALTNSNSLKDDLKILDGPSSQAVEDKINPYPIASPPSSTAPLPPSGPLTMIYKEDFSDHPIGRYPDGWQTLFGVSLQI